MPGSIRVGRIRTGWRRLRYRGRVDPLIREWWENEPSTLTPQSAYTVIDCEMTGLDPNTDRILSMGWVQVREQCIQAASARHFIVQSDASVGQSATIHMIRDCELQNGSELGDVLRALFEDSSGTTPVFHHGDLDLAFLNRACSAVLGGGWWPQFVDTLAIEKRRITRASDIPKAGALTLGESRARYGLPPYLGHNALLDAWATAELLLAQIKKGATLSPLWSN